MTARWFVQTRGADQKDEYRWLSLDGGDATIEPILGSGWQGWPCLSPKGDLPPMASEQVPNLLLYDDPVNGAVLVVTALVHPDRPTDYARRPVRINLAGVAAPGDRAGQKSLVAVAVRALRDELQPRQLVSYGGRAGVTPERERWSAFVSRAVLELAGEPPTEAGLQKPLRGPDSPAFREKVASDLATLCNRGGLPEFAGRPLVVRSGTLSPDDYSRLKPWRIISDSAAEARPEEFDPSVGTTIREAIDHVVTQVDRLRSVGVPVPRFTIPFSVLVVAVIAVVFALPSGGSPVTTTTPPVKPTSSGASPSPSVSTTPTTATPTQLAGTYYISDGATRSTELTGLVATDPTDAIAVGFTCPSTCGAARTGRRPLVEAWNGSQWKARGLPATSGSSIALTVAADSPGDEWVFDSTSSASYAFRWNGSKWAAEPLPDPAADVYAAVAFSANDVWAFAVLPHRSFYVAHYQSGRWTPVYVDASYAPVTVSGAVSVTSSGAIWLAAAGHGSSSAAPQYELLRWTGDAFLPQFSLPRKPLALAVLSSHDIWLAAADGMWNLNGSQWAQVQRATAASALASNGSTVSWLAGGKLFSSDGPSGDLQVNPVSSGGAQTVAAASVPGTGGNSLWAVLSPASQSGSTHRSLAEIQQYSLNS